MSKGHPSEPRTAAGRDMLDDMFHAHDAACAYAVHATTCDCQFRDNILAIEDEALAVRRAHYPEYAEAEAGQRDRPLTVHIRRVLEDSIRVFESFGYRGSAYQRAQSLLHDSNDLDATAGAQRDRLRAAPSVEELAKALHAADIAMLSGEGRPSDYIRWAEQVRAALTDDPEGET